MIKMTCSIRIDYSLGEPTESKIFKITRKKTNKRKKKNKQKKKTKTKENKTKKKNWTSDRYLMVCCCYSDTCKIFQLSNGESTYLSY